MADQRKLDKLFMNVAKQFAELSTCRRLKVGAVITLNNRIVSTGYNGTVPHFINCEEANKDLCVSEGELISPETKYMISLEKREQDSKLHHIFNENFEIHAEMNAILDMAKRGLSPEGTTLYITICPCKNCAKLVATSGIKRIVYSKLYDRDVPCKDLCEHKDYYDEYNGADLIKLMSPGTKIEKFEE